jgi:hypothetical protein
VKAAPEELSRSGPERRRVARPEERTDSLTAYFSSGLVSLASAILRAAA